MPKLTKKRLKQIVKENYDASTLPPDPPIDSPEYTECLPPLSDYETRRNRRDLYDGTAELRLKFENSIDEFNWVNEGGTVNGKSRKLLVKVYKAGRVEFNCTPLFSKPEQILFTRISEDLYERILLRAGTSLPNRRVLKLLQEL